MKRSSSAVSAVVACVVALSLTACDTGDGKTLQPYDPADFPVATTPSTEVTDSFAIVDGEAPPRASLVPAASQIGPDGAFTITAPWQNGQTIDAQYTCDGMNIAPALSWGAVPAGTVEIAVAMVDDSEVSDGQPFVHWVIAGLDPSEIALVEGDVPSGAVQALNYFGDVGYGGPCPPPGDDAHLYRITAYALNQPLELADGSLANEFLDAIAVSSIASIDLTGTAAR